MLINLILLVIMLLIVGVSGYLYINNKKTIEDIKKQKLEMIEQAKNAQIAKEKAIKIAQEALDAKALASKDAESAQQAKMNAEREAINAQTQTKLANEMVTNALNETKKAEEEKLRIETTIREAEQKIQDAQDAKQIQDAQLIMAKAMQDKIKADLNATQKRIEQEKADKLAQESKLLEIQKNQERIQAQIIAEQALKIKLLADIDAIKKAEEVANANAKEAESLQQARLADFALKEAKLTEVKNLEEEAKKNNIIANNNVQNALLLQQKAEMAANNAKTEKEQAEAKIALVQAQMKVAQTKTDAAKAANDVANINIIKKELVQEVVAIKNDIKRFRIQNVQTKRCIHAKGGKAILGTVPIFNDVCTNDERLMYEFTAQNTIRNIDGDLCIQPETGSYNVCKYWKNKYNVVPYVTFGNLPDNLKPAWKSLNCYGVEYHTNWNKRTLCETWKNTYKVVPWVTFGELPEDLRPAWTALDCYSEDSAELSKVENGANLVFDKCDNRSNLKFDIMTNGTIKHKNSGLCVHPKGGIANKDTGLVLDSLCNNDESIRYNLLPEETWSIINGIDYAGQGDLGVINGTIDDCKNKCNATDGCVGFIRRDSDNRCWLKNKNITTANLNNTFNYIYKGASNIGTSRYFMYGPWIGSDYIPVSNTVKTADNIIYLIQTGEHTKMVDKNGIAKYYTGKMADFDYTKWNTYSDAYDNYKLMECPLNCVKGCDKSKVCF